MDEQAILDVLDGLRNKFFGKYRGTVTNVDDPSNLGRIKAKIPGVLTDTESSWCMPCVPYAGPDVGMFFIPEVGAGVWVEFEAGDVSYPVWSGCYWRADEKPAEASPTVKAIKTKSGHTILLDDSGSSITIKDPNENTVTMDNSGITLLRGSMKVAVTDSEVNVNDGALEIT